MDNQILVRCEVCCAVESCESRYSGRVAYRIATHFIATFMDGGTTVEGFVKADMPEGWKMGARALLCPQHAAIEEPK